MGTMFVLRSVLMLIGVLAYLLSPFDIIPEAVFGLIGLLDDLFIIIIVLFMLANSFYHAYAERSRQREVNRAQ